MSAKKFALLGPVRTRARKSSPSVLRKAKNWRFMACWASFFAQMTLEGSRWASFFAEMRLEGACRATFFAPLASLACPATTGESGQARRPQPGRSRPRVIAANEPPAHASYGGGRQHKECLGLKQQRAMHSLHTTPRPQAVQASRAHFFSSVTRYTLVSRSWKPARWYRRFAASREGRDVRSTVRAPTFFACSIAATTRDWPAP